MQRELYTILHQLQLDESSAIISKLQTYYIVQRLRCRYTDNYIMERAAINEDMGIVQLMIDLGADNIDDAMINAVCDGHIDIVQLMLENGAIEIDWAMGCAASGGDVNIVQLMLDKGANNINTAMYNATCCGHINIVQLLLDNGADNYQQCINITKKDNIKDLLRTYMRR